ncbi:hypothetical protein [Tropicibacter sp. S64]|uniref:hypothetical protein n=1 Tax=Tropicibacter sp. S64 TaxID=3415122 RepID=UPI003C7C2F7D
MFELYAMGAFLSLFVTAILYDPRDWGCHPVVLSAVLTVTALMWPVFLPVLILQMVVRFFFGEAR